MHFQLLGRSGLRVSDLCLGTMTFGDDWGWGSAKDEAKKVYDAYREAGGNFIDTANLYTNGTSERFVGEFIADHREEVVLAFAAASLPENIFPKKKPHTKARG
jgi:aryl-alcohol dehydrogenase-like predicted oxidoreductase